MTLTTEPSNQTAKATLRKLDVVVLTNFLALGILIAAIPRFLFSELGASRTQTGIATTIYFVAALLVRPFIGAAVDRAGRRPFLIFPPLFTAAFTLVYLTVDSVGGITLLRFLGGGVAAMFFTSVILAATDVAAPEHRTQALGRQSVMTYTGFIIGPVIADRLIDVSWTLVWIVPAVMHVGVSIIGSFIPETKPQDATGAPAARAGFDRRVVRPGMGVLAANFAFASVVAFLPEYSARTGIDRPGMLFAVYAAAVLVIRALTGRLADHIGPARFVPPMLALGVVAMVALAFAAKPWQSYVAIALVGFSIGGTFPASTSASLARAGAGDKGKAMGTALAMGDVGQASAGPLVGFLSTQWGFRWVYLIPAVVCAIAAGAVLSMPEARGSAHDR